jgi:DNA-damage-inducible protein J
MESVSNINIRIDSNLKKHSDILFKELGLNMTTAISMFLTKCVNTASIPFKIEKYKPNEELLEALEESNKILEDIKSGKRKGYKNIEDLKKSLEEE